MPCGASLGVLVIFADAQLQGCFSASGHAEGSLFLSFVGGDAAYLDPFDVRCWCIRKEEPPFLWGSKVPPWICLSVASRLSSPSSCY